MAKKLVLLEFNELCPDLMDRFIDEGMLPNFARLKNSSFVYTSESGERAPYLEPWIQWVTVHTGLPFSEHKVFDLGDGAKLDVPRIWDLLGQRGEKVWICGSMNASFRKPIDGYILPDPWSTGVQPYPVGEFESYFDFVRLHVQEHTRASVPVSKAASLKFLSFMAGHGLSVETVRDIMKQLLSERSGANRWRRAVLLDSLQWDMFSRYWNKHQPAFSTFFLNSTAHFQHMYWRDMEPARFGANACGAAEPSSYADAIRFGYQHMDKIAGKLFDLIDGETTIVLATALSQQPCLKYEDTGGKVFFRIEDTNSFFRFLGLPSCEYAPVMSEQFRLYFRSEEDAIGAEAKLQSLMMNGRPVMLARRSGAEIFAGCSIFERVERDAMVDSSAGKFRFFERFYDCHLVKSGMHHPDGIFWVRPPTQEQRISSARSEAVRIPLVDLAPTLLALCDMPPPAWMRGQVADCAAQLTA